jgi:hypothetical protein
MSVLCMTEGVPSEILGVPAQDSLVIAVSQRAYEDPRSEVVRRAGVFA